MAAAVGITAGTDQYILVLAGTVVALLLLVAASLVERLLPQNDAPPNNQQAKQIPNRRGAVVPYLPTDEPKGGDP